MKLAALWGKNKQGCLSTLHVEYKYRGSSNVFHLMLPEEDQMDWNMCCFHICKYI